MMIALRGSQTERRSMNRTRYVVSTMKRPVRGKSAAIRLTVSLTSAAPPPTDTRTPAGGARALVGSRRSRTRALASSRLGP
jgi:hypothetical protein